MANKHADIFATQGGGHVVEAVGGWIFVADPPQGFNVGDYMPDEWGIAGPIVPTEDHA